jgi:hypothetical protein
MQNKIFFDKKIILYKLKKSLIQLCNFQLKKFRIMVSERDELEIHAPAFKKFTYEVRNKPLGYAEFMNNGIDLNLNKRFKRAKVDINNCIPEATEELFVYLSEDNQKKIELMIQPKKWIKQKFNLDLQKSYVIIGRQNNEKTQNKNLKSWKVKVINIFFEKIKLFEITTDYLVNIFSNGYYDGPSKKALDITKFNLDELANIFSEREIPVQCQSFRDIYLKYMNEQGFKARPVNLFFENESVFGTEIPNHAACEVYSEELKKWIYLDPYFGGLVLTLNGRYLSLEEVFKNKDDEIELIFLTPQIIRYHKYLDQSLQKVIINFLDFKSEEWNPSESGHFPPYKFFFGNN